MIAPPLLVSFSSLDDYLIALGPSVRKQYEHEIRGLYERGLPPVVSSRCLAVLFGYSTKFINVLSQNNKKYYREFTIRKGKKKRKIQAPRVALKVIQKWFGFHLAQSLNYQNYVFGFVPGRSAVDAARVHCNASWVYSIDIKDFFPSTDCATVKSTLIGLGYSEKSVGLMTPIFCYGDGLAQGAPSSPVLSNLALRDIDRELKLIADTFSVKYTRYADDMVFSGLAEYPEGLRQLVENLFQFTSWSLSSEKCRLAESVKGQRLKVHNLLVHGDKPRLTKGYRNKIRAYRHLVATGKAKPDDITRLIGHIKYAESVDD